MNIKKPRILLFDIETSPALAWVWRSGKQYIDYSQLKTESKFDIICICYKWADENKIYSLDWDYDKQDSSEMLRQFGHILESADLVIGQNCDKFDIRHINTQRLLRGLDPLNWPTTEDTLKQLRKYFYLPSYKLDYVGKLLVGGGKDKMHFQDWINIVERKDKSSFTKLIKYCKNDVMVLFKVWQTISKFCKPKVHMGIIVGEGRDSCPRCGSGEFWADGFRYTRTGKFQSYECMKCGTKWQDSRRAQ